MTKELPFSAPPFQFEPFKGNHVPPYHSGPIIDRLIDSMVDQVRDNGALLMAQVQESESSEIHESKIVKITHTQESPIQIFTSLPVISSNQVNAFAGPMFMASLLRDDMIREEVNASLTIGVDSFEAVSAWKTNKTVIWSL